MAYNRRLPNFNKGADHNQDKIKHENMKCIALSRATKNSSIEKVKDSILTFVVVQVR